MKTTIITPSNPEHDELSWDYVNKNKGIYKAVLGHLAAAYFVSIANAVIIVQPTQQIEVAVPTVWKDHKFYEVKGPVTVMFE